MIGNTPKIIKVKELKGKGCAWCGKDIKDNEPVRELKARTKVDFANRKAYSIQLFLFSAMF